MTTTLSLHQQRLIKVQAGFGFEQIPALHTGLDFYQSGETVAVTHRSPIDSFVTWKTHYATEADYEFMVQKAVEAQKVWAAIPAPRRGEIVRQMGEAFRLHKEDLAFLLTYEMGKIYQEALGEVQEIIDIADFAVGLSRQLYGLTMPSERPCHRMMEQWQPLGVVGIISAFNFPAAVWAWNAMLAAVCGNVSIWKPSEKTPAVAAACMQIVSDVLKRNQLPEGVMSLIAGDASIGKKLSEDHRLALISATGSTRMGRNVAETVSRRFGKTLLELGGNNAIIITPNADLKLALQATVFAAVGTCGQRCTTARRLIIHESIYNDVVGQLKKVYEQLTTKIGNPLEPETLIGPLIDENARKAMLNTLKDALAEGGNILFGGSPLTEGKFAEGAYVVPALVEAKNEFECVQRETFAPILYLLKYKDIEEAVAMNNGVPQGLSSSIFSNHLRETEYFLSHAGSDCGIANVNIGPSGAEIGGAFGGEKETGGGRESGSDAWKAYMRRQTVTINYSTALPLAQGIKFEI